MLDLIKLLVGIERYCMQASLSLELLILHPLKKICGLNCPLHLCPALLNIFQTFSYLPVEIILKYIKTVTNFFLRQRDCLEKALRWSRSMEIIKAGVFQSGEKKISMTFCKKDGHLQENGGKQFSRACCDRTRGNGFKPKIGGFKSDIRKNFFL